MALGFIEGLSDGAAGVARLAGGALADDPQRRRSTAVGGYASTAVLSALIGTATAIWQVAFLRLGAWVARGIRVPARNALLADAVPPRAYGRAYGFERMMDNVGAILGPLIALGLIAAFSLRTAILISVIPGLLAVLAIVYAIRRLPRSRARHHDKVRLRVREALGGGLGRVFIGITAFELGNVAATLMILRVTEHLTPEHGRDRAAGLSVILYLGYNVAAAIVSLPAGKVVDRLGGIVVMATGAGLFGVAYVSLATADAELLLLAFAFAAAGLGIGCVETAEHATVAALAPPEVRGSAFGLLAAAQSFGNLAASSVVGLLWSVFSPRVAFGYAATWMLIALAGFFFARPMRSQAA